MQWKAILTIAIITMVTVAIVLRFKPLRNLVFGQAPVAT